MSDTDRTYERTLYEAKLDADYEVRLNLLHARLYGRARIVIVVVSLFAGTTAFASALGSHGLIVGGAGFAIAFATIFDVAFDFANKKAMHEAQRKRYLRLLREAPDTLEEFDKQLRLIAEDDLGYIEALRMPAYNDNLATHGITSYQQRLTRWQRVVSAIA